MGTPIDSNAGDEVQGDIIPDQDSAPGPNPAWNDVLSILPEGFHEAVTEHFQKWDTAANQRIETVNASLKEFESYKPFLEHGINPDELQQGLRLLYEVNNNPQAVYDALAEAYKFGQNADPNKQESEEEPDPTALMQDPRFNELQQGLELVSQIVLNDAQAKQNAQADIELERELDSLKEKYGDYDVDYVLTKMLNGASGEDAVTAYKELVGRLSPQPFAPSILGSNSGSGSGLPSNAIDPTKLSGKDTRNLVAEMVKRQLGN